MWPFRKKKSSGPYANVDFEIWADDSRNGMPYGKQMEKLKAGGYRIGNAVPSKDYGRIDNEELYRDYVELFGERHAEVFRRKGMFMNRE